VDALILLGTLLLPITEDVCLLACAVQTEAGTLGALRQDAGEWVAHVALNRAEAGWWGTLADTLRDDFHGIGACANPEPWALLVAARAMVRERDAAEGSLFVLSTADLDRLGWVEPARSFEGGGVGLHFYRRWHWQ
jgi:hypothetical protein